VESLKIVGSSVLGAVLYGVLHDQVTARICVEYFTIGHPHLLATESPIWLGLAWGILGTWWVGLALGLALVFVARRGPGPRRTSRSLRRPIAILLASMAVLSVLGGFAGLALARAGWVILLEPSSSRVSAEHHVNFIAVLWAHWASYLSGVVGGLALVWSVWRGRRLQRAGAARADAAAELDAR
jgi:hypothetical protein